MGWFIPKDLIQEGWEVEFYFSVIFPHLTSSSSRSSEDLISYKDFQGNISDAIWQQFRFDPVIKSKLRKLGAWVKEIEEE